MTWRHHIDIQSNLDGSNTQGTDENSSVRAIEVELCLNLNKGTTKKVRDIHGVRVCCSSHRSSTVLHCMIKIFIDDTHP